MNFFIKHKSFLLNLLIIVACASLISITGLQDALANTSTTGVNDEQDSLILMLCNVINYATGNLAKAVATIVLVALGIGFFSGNINWSALVGTAAAIGMVFGAPAIILKLTSGGVSGQSFCARKFVDASDLDSVLTVTP